MQKPLEVRFQGVVRPSTLRKLSSAWIALCCCLLSSTYGAQYSITDLGTLGGTESLAYGINNRGQVVGSSKTPGDTQRHAFLYSDGRMQDLGTLSGGVYSQAYEINANGQIVGVAETTVAGLQVSHAFVYSDGSMHDLGTFGGYSYACGINAAGQIVGYSERQFPSRECAFVISDGVMRDIGAGETSRAGAINSSGQIVGCYSTEKPGFIYSGGTVRSLGTLGGRYSIGQSINDAGTVVGYSATASGNEHAFLWSNGRMQDLGTLGGYLSHAVDINSSGQVVGLSVIEGQTGMASVHGFVYSNGVMADLNTLVPANSGWILNYAWGLNDVGQIVGSGTVANGELHAFVLTPVPEPATIALFVLPMLLMGRRARR